MRRVKEHDEQRGLFENVAESLALLSREVSILNAVNLYDINIVAEDFFPGLLNLIYGYELKNANYLEKNAPAIDLVDPKNRIAVQVTSDNSSTKIKHTIEEFNKNKAYQSYDRLIVLILTQKKNILPILIHRECFHLKKKETFGM